MVAPRRPARPGAPPGAHFVTRADIFRSPVVWNRKPISYLPMAWSLLHHRHAMGPLRPVGTPDTHEGDTLRARLRRLEEARALAGIGRLLSERLEPDVVGLRIAESLRSLLASGSAVVYRLDSDSQSLHALAVSHATDPSGGWRPVREPGSGAVGLAIRERRTITTPDALGDPRIETSADLRRHLEQAPDRAILAVPLLTQDRLIGVLAMRNATGSVFDARAVQMAEALADQAALTLENARLFADEEHRRREAEILAELARTIGGTLDLETVLRRVTEAAQELCRSQMAVPVLIEDRVEGLLYVDNRAARAFTDQDEAILARLAAQAALAIRNAQLFADEQVARGTAERLVRALRESQERFQFVSRATNDAVWD